MVTNLNAPSSVLSSLPDEVMNPATVIDTMVELRMNLYEIEQQIQALQPAFFAACTLLNLDKIKLERAVISRRLTPGQWTYAPHILEQQELFKQLKQQFQKEHEPTSGRDITWTIKLLLAIASLKKNTILS